MPDPVTHTLAVPGAILTYDVRGDLTDREQPVLLMIGSPMAASGFPTLAAQFETLAAHGRSGDMSKFVSDLKGSRAALAHLQEGGVSFVGIRVHGGRGRGRPFRAGLLF